MFALLAIPMILAVGAAIDYGRVYVAAKNMQSVVDAAALAGAEVFTASEQEAFAIATAQAYFTKGLSSLPDYAGASAATITTQPTDNCDDGAAERITVTATVTVATTLMGVAIPSMTVDLSATAANPQVKFYLDVVNFDFSAEAGDLDGLYWFKVPADGSSPLPGDLEFIINNMTATAPTTITACISSAQKIGFSFSVSPAGKFHYYNVNTYGGRYGQTYYYHSTLFPPSKEAYPAWPHDGALQIVDVASDGSYPPPTTSTFSPPGTHGYGYFPANAQPMAAVASTGAVSCAGLAGRAIHLYWNDMGPNDDPELVPNAYDDFNYTDGEITFGCESSDPKPVHLER